MKTAENMGLFQSSPLFYMAIMLQLFIFDFIGWGLLYMWGASWPVFLLASIFLATSQVHLNFSFYVNAFN